MRPRYRSGSARTPTRSMDARRRSGLRAAGRLRDGLQCTSSGDRTPVTRPSTGLVDGAAQRPGWSPGRGIAARTWRSEGIQDRLHVRVGDEALRPDQRWAGCRRRSPPTCSTTSGSVVSHFRNSTASGGASRPTAKLSPPPKTSVASPAPPSTIGKGNQPRASPMPSPDSLFDGLGARGPLALEHHRRLAVAELALLLRHASPRGSPPGTAPAPTRRWSSWPAGRRHSPVQSPVVMALFMASWPPMRVAR